MRKPVVWNLSLSLIGLGALLVYILACTSFSPDDSKVLYLTTDPRSGMTAVAVYDRKAGKSEQLFEPFTVGGSNDASTTEVIRPQWLNAGHDYMVSWPGRSKDPASLNIAIRPFDRRGVARTFSIPALNDDGPEVYFWPLPVVGTTLFLHGQSNTLVRLNLETGQLRRQTIQSPVIPISSPENEHLLYLGGEDVAKNVDEIGVLNPETLERTPLFKIKDANIDVFSLALSRDAKRCAYQIKDDKRSDVQLLENGLPVRTLSLASLGERAQVSVREFSPKSEVIYGSLENSTDGTNFDYGFVEIPVDGSAIRQTTLLRGVQPGNDDAFTCFQIDLSHDGKTLAVESLWLAYGDHPIKADDCALFLVDLTDPHRKVTKVPISPPPAGTPNPLK